ncbi:MAG: hypothetical protein OXG85_03150 [Chloroflexi bacterium]|nr:hypothetical protein [Chloroflexota bacterium]
MSFVFRSIGNKHWYSADQPDFSGWLQDGELVADVLKELRTIRGCLSVYKVDSDKQNLDRVISAYACTRNSLNDIDYVLVPLKIIFEQFDTASTLGATADDEVNKLHLDIEHLSVSKLLLLARVFQDHHSAMHRIRKRNVKSKIEDCIRKNHLVFSRIDESIQRKFPEFSAT